MSKIVSALAVCLVLMSCNTQKKAGINTATNDFTKDSLDIANVLMQQSRDWNTGSLEAYMNGYWKSPNLTFGGSKGITYGWEQTLRNYKKGYPNQEIMGQLTFDIIQIKPLGSHHAQVLGKYTLVRNLDKPTGHFSLTLEKIEGKWLIISDMTAGT